MSDRAKPFFEWVWRLNGLLLLGGMLVCLVVALFLMVDAARFASREDPERQLTEVAGADLAAQNLQLDEFHEIAGTRFLYAQLAPPTEYFGSGGYGESLGSARNLLFFDTATHKAHWLFPTNEQTIASFSFLMDPPREHWGVDAGGPDGPDRVALAILLELAAVRREGEPSKATRRLAVGSPDGRELTTIAEASEGLLGYHQGARDSVFVFYVSEGAAKVLEVDPTTRATRSDRVLSTGD